MDLPDRECPNCGNPRMHGVETMDGLYAYRCGGTRMIQRSRYSFTSLPLVDARSGCGFEMSFLKGFTRDPREEEHAQG
jgi:hypothetical protein